jgi:hypothetical protein
MKNVRVILSDEAREVFENLNKDSESNKQSRSILNAIKNKTELIKQNVHYGRPISKKLIPSEYLAKYNIKNLFRVELPNFWRMLYTLTNNEQIEIVAFVLDIMDHKKYNKKFGY